MKPIILQVAVGEEHEGMANESREWYYEYCRRHDYDHVIIPRSHDTEPSWEKLNLTRIALRDGHPFVFVLDADAIIANPTVPLTDALSDHAWLGMAIHPWASPWTTYHWQAGVMYWRNTPEAIKFIDRCFEVRADDKIPKWCWEQGAINYLLNYENDWQQGVVALTHHWNANIHNQPGDGAVVGAFHGAGPFRRVMFTEYLRQLQEFWREAEKK